MSERQVTNLVPKDKVDCLAKKLDYEVLGFYTQFEFETCETEKEMKKHIMAKFRAYDDALDYANRLLKARVYYDKVILRA